MAKALSLTALTVNKTPRKRKETFAKIDDLCMIDVLLQKTPIYNATPVPKLDLILQRFSGAFLRKVGERCPGHLTGVGFLVSGLPAPTGSEVRLRGETDYFHEIAAK